MSKLPKSRSVSEVDRTSQAYFSDISVHKLLTKEREIELSKELKAAEVSQWRWAFSEHSNFSSVLVAVKKSAEDRHSALEQLSILEQFFLTHRDELSRGKTMRDKRVSALASSWRTLVRAVGTGLRRHDPYRENIRSVARVLETVGTPLQLSRVRGATARASRASNEFVSSNLKLVASVIRSCHWSYGDFMDCNQDGALGLIRAVESFDHEFGVRFATYACWWIRQTIKRGREQTGDVVRIPVHMQAVIYAVKRTSREFASKKHREPTPEEIASETGHSVEKISQAITTMNMRVNTVHEKSLGGRFDDDAYDLIDNLTSESRTHEMLERLEDADIVRTSMGALTSREQFVIDKRFGLSDDEELTLNDIGNMLGLSRERIRQIESKALKKISVRLGLDRHQMKAVSPTRKYFK